MRVIVLGATGPFGVLVVKEYFKVYLDSTVITYARNPSKLPADLISNPAVTVAKGELTDKAALTSAFKAGGKVDALLSTVGLGMGHPNTLLLTAAYKEIISVMAAQGCKPSSRSRRFIQRSAWRDIVTYSKFIAEECDKHDIEWTLVRVLIKRPSPEFYVREIEGKEWVRKAPALSYCEIIDANGTL
ncbi:hypothetical protein B0H13DRAFT_2553789 [Mycena leptocephala]|nr:hypothetical protein B0H13DRAFT_2553789 [Mycena leptocephala]